MQLYIDQARTIHNHAHLLPTTCKMAALLCRQHRHVVARYGISLAFSRAALIMSGHAALNARETVSRYHTDTITYKASHTISLSRSISSRPYQRKDLYSILNVSPTATQSQIKESYYKLSMRFHPDKNKGSVEAKERFVQITDAYSILGQYEMRKRYDKGLLHGYTPPPHARHFKQSESTQNTKKPVYDFDEFYRAHYGEALKREQRMRETRASKSKQHKAVDDIHQQIMIATVTVLVFVIGWYSYKDKTRKQ